MYFLSLYSWLRVPSLQDILHTCMILYTYFVFFTLVQGSGTTHTVFKGNKKPTAKECVLIIDHETGTYTLEKLDQNVLLKKTRFGAVFPLFIAASLMHVRQNIKTDVSVKGFWIPDLQYSVFHWYIHNKWSSLMVCAYFSVQLTGFDPLLRIMMYLPKWSI